MTCFYHNRLNAVGTCKYCQKGLCERCAADTGVGLACVNKCENQVKMMAELLEKQVQALGKKPGLFSRLGGQ